MGFIGLLSNVVGALSGCSLSFLGVIELLRNVVGALSDFGLMLPGCCLLLLWCFLMLLFWMLPGVL